MFEGAGVKKVMVVVMSLGEKRVPANVRAVGPYMLWVVTGNLCSIPCLSTSFYLSTSFECSACMPCRTDKCARLQHLRFHFIRLVGHQGLH